MARRRFQTPHRWDLILGNTEDHDITFSIVSLWEIAIKRALGTLELAVPMADFSRQLQEDHGFRQINIEPEELDRLQILPTTTAIPLTAFSSPKPSKPAPSPSPTTATGKIPLQSAVVIACLEPAPSPVTVVALADRSLRRRI